MEEEEAPECTTTQDVGPIAERSAPACNKYLLSYAFNQDGTCFVCGTTAGFRVFNAAPAGELRRREDIPAFQDRSVTLISMLMRTQIYALVTAGRDLVAHEEPTKIRIWDEKQGRFVGEIRSKQEVKGIAMRADIIAMVCQGYVRVYKCSNLHPILYIETAPNPRGLCAIALSSKPWVLCCPGEAVGGLRVQVGPDESFDFRAHETAVAAVAVGEAGTRLATASEFGTVIKVWRRSDGELLHRLRIGAPSIAGGQVVSSIAFRFDEDFVAVAACTSPTVYVFRLGQRPGTGAGEAEGQAAGDGLLGGLTKTLSSLTTVLTDLQSCARLQIPNVDAQGRPEIDTRSEESRIMGPLVAFHRSEPRLTVLHYSGMVYEASFNPASERCQDCTDTSATMWFAVRPDFKLAPFDSSQPATTTAAADVQDGEDEGGEEWQLL